MKTLIFLATFASVTLHVPNATQTVLGAATTTARVGDTVRVGVFVDQADAGLTELFTAVPYNPSLLTYAGLEPGSSGTLTAVNVKATATQASLNMTWKGLLPAGQSLHLGYAKFAVTKADGPSSGGGVVRRRRTGGRCSRISRCCPARRRCSSRRGRCGCRWIWPCNKK